MILGPKIPKAKQTCQLRNLINVARQVHLELCLIARNVNESFGPQLLCAIATNYAMAIQVAYSFVANLLMNIRSPQVNNQDNTYLLYLIVWIVFFIARVVLVNFVCTRTSSEAFKVSNMICEINGKISAVEIPEEVVLNKLSNALIYFKFD